MGEAGLRDWNEIRRQRYRTDPEYRQKELERARAYRKRNPGNATGWAKENPEQNRLHQRRHYLRKRFNLSLEEFDALLCEQDYRCAICGSASAGPWRDLVVDHCHQTGEVRGLLCHACNVGIGQLRDDPALIRRALAYLERK